MLTIKRAIEQRRSVRNFKADPVSDKQINALLDAAILAPSSCNSQPWRFKIVKDKNIYLSLQRPFMIKNSSPLPLSS